MNKPPRPTESEISILRILWEEGASDVRTVAEGLSRERGREVGYTTALKLLQLMLEKDLVVRDETGRSHRYSARHPEETMKRSLVGDFVKRVFGGSSTRLALHALSAEEATPEEIEELEAILQELKRKGRR